MVMKTKKIGSLTATVLVICACVIGCSVTKIVRSQYEDYAPKPVLYCDGKTVAEVILDDSSNMIRCVLYEVEEDEDAVTLIHRSGLPHKYIHFNAMLELITNCTKLAMPMNSTEATPTNSTSLSSSQWSAITLWNGILPGTKWCGIGDIADSFEELGTQFEVDACCRAHDYCPVKLKAFRTGYGLINLSLYTKSHCDCDKEFYGCLKETRNKLADAVGHLYFNFMGIQCLREHRPFICIENKTEIDGTQQCMTWSEDPNSKKMKVTLPQLKY